MQQKLKSEFPVDWLDDQYVSRREFFKFLTLASGGMAVTSLGMAAWSLTPRDHRTFDPKLIAQAADIPVGGWLQFTYPRPEDTCILIRTGDATFAGFSRRCTHLSCPVIWQPQETRLFCPCHEGAFSIEDGHVLQGPPGRPLPQIKLRIQSDGVYAIGVTNGEA